MLKTQSQLQYVKKHFNLTRDLSNEEKLLIRQSFEEYDNDPELVIDTFRVDHTSDQLIQDGYVVFNNFFFKSDIDAVNWVNQNTEYNISHFSELYDMAQNGEIDDCYYTEWH